MPYLTFLLCLALFACSETKAQGHELFWQDASFVYPKDFNLSESDQSEEDANYYKLSLQERANLFKTFKQERGLAFLNLAQNCIWYQNEACTKKLSKKRWEKLSKTHDLEGFSYKLKLSFDAQLGLFIPEVIALGLNFTASDGAFAPPIWIKPQTAPRTVLEQALKGQNNLKAYDISTKVGLSTHSEGRVSTSPDKQRFQLALIRQVWSPKRGFKSMKLKSVLRGLADSSKQEISLDQEANWDLHRQWLGQEDSLSYFDTKTLEQGWIVYKASSEINDAISGFYLATYLIYQPEHKRFVVCFDYLDLDLTWEGEGSLDRYLEKIRHLRLDFQTLRFELD